ncbi:lipopolysaccharide heptosyltransferase II [Piscirickettsia litoralis]|uniref:lipopolysaccharide heptosyltransferase II n=2 Tax=Piscirickettsia litoralis TaxID=1891921 RepID=A0ABX3A3Z9_9GAMM|nr:lipopolysaccharide heptosyltransferase II [Piscirickettsia litoralis]
MMMAQSLFKVLLQQHPGVNIDVLAPDWTFALLARMPEVREAISAPFAHGQFAFKERIRLGKVLQKKRYDQAIVLPNSWKSALVPWAANIPQRTGWLGEFRYGLLNDARKLDKEKCPLMVQRMVALAYPKGAKILPAMCPNPELIAADKNVEMALAKLKLEPQSRPVLALSPGAEFGPSKKWPTDYFAKVALEKIHAGWQVWLFGSKKDETVAKEVLAKAPECINLVGKTNLEEAVDLLSVAAQVVSNDSGLMHIAASLGKPTVAIYGSTDPGFTPPLGKKVTVLEKELECRPCFKRECPLEHHHCMQYIKPDEVLRALDQLS